MCVTANHRTTDTWEPFVIYSNPQTTFIQLSLTVLKPVTTKLFLCVLFIVCQNVISPLSNSVWLKKHIPYNNEHMQQCILLHMIKLCHVDCLFYVLYGIWHQYSASILVWLNNNLNYFHKIWQNINIPTASVCQSMVKIFLWNNEIPPPSW